MTAAPCRVEMCGLCLLVAACASQAPPPEATAGEIHLHKIGRAYLRACDGLKRPPRNAAELRPYLDPSDGEDVFRSPRDGEEYVILWGVKAAELQRSNNSDPGQRYPVLAYEKRGATGQRYVLQMPPQVTLMSDEELKKARFPSAHKPALP
jgi:hypothetical protein